MSCGCNARRNPPPRNWNAMMTSTTAPRSSTEYFLPDVSPAPPRVYYAPPVPIPHSPAASPHSLLQCPPCPPCARCPAPVPCAPCPACPPPCAPCPACPPPCAPCLPCPPPSAPCPLPPAPAKKMMKTSPSPSDTDLDIPNLAIPTTSSKESFCIREGFRTVAHHLPSGFQSFY